jgi:hypothetical protein
MLKILVLIECDTCHLPFSEIAVTTLGDPFHWHAMASDLEYNAETSGWHCFHSRHDCFECILQTMHPEEFRQP